MLLTKVGLQDAVMLNSDASTLLVYQRESLVGYVPRPIPHVVALLDSASTCENPQLVCELIVRM